MHTRCIVKTSGFTRGVCKMGEQATLSQKIARKVDFTMHLVCTLLISRTKNQPKEEVFRTDIPRTSGGHSRGYPGPKLRSRRSKPWKTQALRRGHPWPEGADVHDPDGFPKTSVRKTLGWIFAPYNSEKILVQVKFVSAILGPEMAAPILWTPGKMRPFCRKTHVHKIPRLRRFFFWGGGKCRFYFYGREDFSE